MKNEMDILPLEQWNEYNRRPFVIAGPCSAETEAQVMETAMQLKREGRTDVFRAGVWKPRTRPNSFEGVGADALPWLRRVQNETGLPVMVEVATAKHVYEALKYNISLLWIGARTTANPFAVQEIADALRGAGVGVLVKNPVNPDLELWYGAVERIYGAGIRKIGLVHRGFSTYNKSGFRNLPHWQIPIEMKSRLPQVAMINDPSHIGGKRELLEEIAQKAMDLNFDGLMIEAHRSPDEAWSDAQQQITPAELTALLHKLVLRSPHVNKPELMETLTEMRGKIDDIDDRLLQLLEKRMNIARSIGRYKKINNMSVLQNKRWEEIIYKNIEKGKKKGLSREFINKLFKAIHQESINHQVKILNEKEDVPLTKVSEYR